MSLRIDRSNFWSKIGSSSCAPLMHTDTIARRRPTLPFIPLSLIGLTLATVGVVWLGAPVRVALVGLGQQDSPDHYVVPNPKVLLARRRLKMHVQCPNISL